MSQPPSSQISVAADFSRPAAFAIAASLMLIPANYLPILATDSGGTSRTDTIYSGMMALYENGLWPLALIVATASLVVPFAKLGGLTCLMFTARHGRSVHAKRWTRVYAVLSSIGRWSMLDVFLVAFLTSAVRFGPLSTIRPRAGIFAFASAVVFTILATRAFDPRLLWREPVSTPAPVSSA